MIAPLCAGTAMIFAEDVSASKKAARFNNSFSGKPAGEGRMGEKESESE